MKSLVDRPTALYRFYDSTRAPVYFGIAVDPESRWIGHRNEPWWQLVDHRYTQVDWHDDRPAARKAEATAIKAECPPYNRAHAECRPTDGIAMTAEAARKNFADMLGQTQWRGKSVAITRHGQRVAVALPPDWYDRALAALAAHEPASPKKRQ